MPAADRKPQRTPPRDALERLYVYSAAAAILFALGLLLVSFLATGRMEQLARELDQLSDRLARLESHAAVADQPAGAPSRRPEPTTSASRSQPAAPEPTAASQPRPHAAPEPAESLTPIRASTFFRQAVDSSARLPRLRNPAAARAFLDAADNAPLPDLDGPTCRMLAVVARLAGDDGRARRFAERCERLGADLADYLELTARDALDHGRPAEALAAARDLARTSTRTPHAALLAACAALAQRQPVEARAALAAVGPPGNFDVDDRLALCAVQLTLENWAGLASTLDTLATVPPQLTDRRDFFRAVLLAVSEHFAEAVAMLDALIDSHPDDYDPVLWRAIALMRARQPEAARQGLSHATRISAGRPEAWYWLGVLDVSQGDSDGAAFFHNALAASTRFAPAWEALATQALNGGELHTAVDNARRAVDADPGRPSAHFLLAICEARAGRRDAAASSLRAAFELDPALVDEAARVESITALFAAGELAALAPPRAPASAPGSTP